MAGLIFFLCVLLVVIFFIVLLKIEINKDLKYENKLKEDGKKFIEEQNLLPKSKVQIITNDGVIIKSDYFEPTTDIWYCYSVQLSLFTSEQNAKDFIKSAIKNNSVTIQDITYPICNIKSLEVVGE